MFLLVYCLTSPDIPYLLIFFDEREARQAIAEDGLIGTLITVRCKSPPETGSELEYSRALIEALRQGITIKCENFY